MAIDFAQIGILTGVAGVPIDSPTSIQFGPDGRLYVASVSGQIAAYDVAIDEDTCLLYTSPSPRDGLLSRMPSSA